MSTENEHYVIFSKKQMTVFSTHKTKDEADKELEFQMSTIPVEQRSKLDWEVVKKY